MCIVLFELSCNDFPGEFKDLPISSFMVEDSHTNYIHGLEIIIKRLNENKIQQNVEPNSRPGFSETSKRPKNQRKRW